MDEAMVAKVENFASSDLPQQTKLALAFFESWITARAGTMDEAFFDELKQHFTSAQIVELAALAGLYEYIHKFNHLFEQPQPNYPSFKHVAPPAGMEEAFEQLRGMRKPKVT